jgi:hypothetical protein
MVQSCGALAAHREGRTTLPHRRGTTGAPGARGWPRRPRTPPRTPLQGGARCARFDGGGRAHRACAPCVVPCAVPGCADRASRLLARDHLERLLRYREWMTVRELLTELQHLPRDLEVLAFEAGCEDYCEREVDELELQGGRVYLHLGARRDEPQQR